MSLLLKLALPAVIAFAALAHAEDATFPKHLTLGYDNEGKIDASPQACLALVKEVTQWDKAESEQGAKQVCAARKRHVDAYATLQADYAQFVKAFSTDRRLDLVGAIANFKTLFKACVEHKFGLTTGGHNIMIDVIENDIATDCLTLGANLLKQETGAYTAK
jgi:hypothetical protein